MAIFFSRRGILSIPLINTVAAPSFALFVFQELSNTVRITRALFEIEEAEVSNLRLSVLFGDRLFRSFVHL